MSDKQTPENAVDYKATLNLPGTEFAMKANLAVREAKWLETFLISFIKKFFYWDLAYYSFLAAATPPLPQTTPAPLVLNR